MDDTEQPQEYWDGVQDALNLMKDFIYWNDLNPDASRTMKDFVVDSLETIVKFTKPRLRDLLNLGFRNQLDRD